VVGASVVATTLLLWQALLVEEHKHIERTIQSAAARVQNEVTVHIDARILALARMAQRWEYTGRPPQAQWEFEARMNLQHFPGYQAIAWVDSANKVRWLVSQDAAQTVHNLRVAFEKLGQRDLETVRDQHAVTVTQAVDLVQGGKGFVVLVPLFYDQDFSGFIVGIFGFQELLNVVLKNIAPGYMIAVFDDVEEVYRRDSIAGEIEEEWRQEMTIDPYGITWRAWIWPQPEVLAEVRSALPEVVLDTGVAMATLLALTVAFAQAARRRMRETTVAYVGLTREMAERQHAEQALRKAHAELELRVQERTTDLARVNESLQVEVGERKRAEEALARQAQELARSNAELEQFAYVASHDLQEPLRKILAFGDRLRVKCSEALGDQGRDYLERMQAAATRMQALIIDSLTLSRVTTQLQPFVPVDLSEVAQEVVSDMEVRIQQVGGRVHIESLPTLDADPLQMRQLLQNLISNALKFHRNGELPVVQVRGALLQEQAAEQNGQTPWHCQIWVEDNGIGFDEKYLDRIFDPFQRLHGRGEYEGTGMGLAICRKIVERHGGEISAKSAPGQGATFIVTLPIIQPHRGHRNAKAEHTSHHSHGG
jgi:signal transduction histidine kinase